MEENYVSINRRADKEEAVYISTQTLTHTHTMKYYSDIKKKEFLQFAIT